MEEETEPQEEAPEEAAVAVAEPEEQEEVAEVEEESHDSEEARQVPLTALQKERKKRQEEADARRRAEIELQYLREQSQRKEPEEDDDSQYESVTRGEYVQDKNKTMLEVKRDLREEMWAESHKEEMTYVNEHLEDFLKLKPHLAQAIGAANNRYAEAYELMTALTPRQRQEMKQSPKKAAPKNPTSVPKAAGVQEAVDVMSMSDEEYRAWRQSKRKRR